MSGTALTVRCRPNAGIDDAFVEVSQAKHRRIRTMSALAQAEKLRIATSTYNYLLK
ncbi:MAG TPA: hypothetical protein VM715_03275 [Candidatus Acidoferrum sp.]|jgi:hypothetical protein|nr:hypothetical protein [Candidatus Acidoferrum sp.]